MAKERSATRDQGLVLVAVAEKRGIEALLDDVFARCEDDLAALDAIWRWNDNSVLDDLFAGSDDYSF